MSDFDNDDDVVAQSQVVAGDDFDDDDEDQDEDFDEEYYDEDEDQDDDDEYDASALIQEVIAAEQAHKEAVAEYAATMEMIKNRRVAHIKELVAQNVPVADIAKVYPRKFVLEVTAPVVTQPAAAEVAQST